MRVQGLGCLRLKLGRLRFRDWGSGPEGEGLLGSLRVAVELEAHHTFELFPVSVLIEGFHVPRFIQIDALYAPICINQYTCEVWV